MTAPVSIFPVAKRCWVCGARWTGNSFVQHPEGSELLSTCTTCLDQEDAAGAARQAPAPRPAPTPHT